MQDTRRGEAVREGSKIRLPFPSSNRIKTSLKKISGGTQFQWTRDVPDFLMS